LNAANAKSEDAIFQCRETAKIQEHLSKGSIETVEILDANLCYTFVDSMWEVVFGWSREEIIGSHLLDVIALGLNSSGMLREQQTFFSLLWAALYGAKKTGHSVLLWVIECPK
jgi:PAS domain-containing protein